MQLNKNLIKLKKRRGGDKFFSFLFSKILKYSYLWFLIFFNGLYVNKMFYLAKLVLNIASKASDICIAKPFIKKTCEKIA